MTAVVLVALPMQKDISNHLPGAAAPPPVTRQITVTHEIPTASEIPMAHEIAVAQEILAAAEIPVAAAEPAPDEPISEDAEVEETGVEETEVDATEPDAAAEVTLELPTVGIPLAGTFTAKVVTWDTSAAAMRLNQQDAARHVAEAGLKWTSTGRCTDRRKSSCTSLDSIRYGTLMRLIDLRRASGCEITITGGTETGHADGRYSHENGYKVDIAHNKCIDAYVRGKFRRLKSRGDGSTLYRPPSDSAMSSASAVYADERTHWDILFL